MGDFQRTWDGLLNFPAYISLRCNHWKGSVSAMTKGRMEAFSDGVFAVIITIMVLELPVPKAPGMAALQPL